MDCRNETLAFIDDYYSYGLIGLVGVALLLYMIYLVIYIGTDHFSSSNSIYLNFSQLSLLLILLSPLTFIVRSSTSMESICSMRTLSVQILPFCLLLGFNVDFIDQCLLKINQAKAHRYLQNISSFLIFLLAILIQTIILLIWFYQQDEINWFYPICKNECYQKSLLYSMSFQYFLLIFYGIQSTIRFHLSSNPSNFISLLISLLITTLTVLTVSLYLFVPLRNYVSQALSDETILGYSLTLFGYSFLCPMLFGQIYQVCRRRKSTKIRQVNIWLMNDALPLFSNL